MRQDELVFFGMAPAPKTKEQELHNSITKTYDIEKERKETQKENYRDYMGDKKKIHEEIKDNEGPDIEEAMLKDRRDWIKDEMANNGMKPPVNLNNYYSRFDVAAPLTPEEEALKRLQEEEDAKAAKKKKKDKKKKKKKKKKSDDDDKPDIVMTGPTECVQKFDEFYSGYNESWANRDESENFKQEYDQKLAKQEIMPKVEDEYKKAVDDMI